MIFGATGGVMEAALRTVVEILTGEELQKLEFKEVRGLEGIKEASYMVNGMEVKAAIVSGLSNAKKLMEKVKNGEVDYHFVEIMACPGGCINGGGQPHVSAEIRNNVDYRTLRAKALYDYDEAYELRKSHKNPDIQKLYDEFLEKPNSHIAHELLHTSYVPRSIN